MGGRAGVALQIPTTLAANTDDGKVVQAEIDVAGSKWSATLVRHNLGTQQHTVHPVDICRARAWNLRTCRAALASVVRAWVSVPRHW
jgi:hypothetical protein